MDDVDDDDRSTPQSRADTTGRTDQVLTRRTYLKSIGTTGVATAAVSGASNQAQAASDGYGAGGYGGGPYGDPSGLAVSTAEATNITDTTAMLNGSLDDLDGADSADCYFKWRPVGADTWTTTATQTLSSTGSFSDDLSGLDDGGDYEYKAIAEASDGDTAEGATVAFTTTDNPPAVTTDSPTNVSDSSAVLNGSLDDLGTASAADCYFEWREGSASSWTTTATQTLSSTGAFSADITGLASETDYEYRAVANASDGDAATGSTVSFTTDSSDTAPAIDTFATTDTSNPAWARVEVDWAVSDADSDLSGVELALKDWADTVVDTASHSVSGGTASGIDELRDKWGSGDYTVVLTITDAAGNETTDSKGVTIG